MIFYVIFKFSGVWWCVFLILGLLRLTHFKAYCYDWVISVRFFACVITSPKFITILFSNYRPLSYCRKKIVFKSSHLLLKYLYGCKPQILLVIYSKIWHGLIHLVYTKSNHKKTVLYDMFKFSSGWDWNQIQIKSTRYHELSFENNIDKCVFLRWDSHGQHIHTDTSYCISFCVIFLYFLFNSWFMLSCSKENIFSLYDLKFVWKCEIIPLIGDSSHKIAHCYSCFTSSHNI